MARFNLVSGTNRATLEIADPASVAAIRDRFGAAFEISNNASVTVNGLLAGDASTVLDGDNVVFAKVTGEKGDK